VELGSLIVSQDPDDHRAFVACPKCHAIKEMPTEGPIPRDADGDPDTTSLMDIATAFGYRLRDECEDSGALDHDGQPKA
jgi:hypothetical protein